MAQLLPAEGEGRPLALMLLIAILIIAYFAVVQPTLDANAALNGDIDTLTDKLHDFKARADQKKILGKRLKEMERYEQNDAYFLDKSDFNLAAAELTRRIKALVKQHAGNAESCQVVSSQNIRPKNKERFEQVKVKVRMRCDLPDLIPVLYDLEGGTPYVLVDNVNIYRQQVRVRRGKAAKPTFLDVRFDAMAYMKPEGSEKSSEVKKKTKARRKPVSKGSRKSAPERGSEQPKQKRKVAPPNPQGRDTPPKPESGQAAQRGKS